VKHILSPESVDLLAQLASSRVLLAFDFDGTLAPIVADRDQAKMRIRTSTLLKAACALYPCAVISGRAQGDVTTRLGRIGVKHVVGNHGIEPGADAEIAVFESEMAVIRPLLEHALVDYPGLEIEDKRYSLAVHYRGARRKREARIAIDRAVARLPRPMRVVPGKLVANVIPVGARNKGDILLELRDREPADIALYVGDDVTDEDVFTLDQPGRLLSMRVGRTKLSAARFFLHDQHEIDGLLEWMVKLRKDRRRT
jgi:trehalose 6-phosphate phosphatase